MASFNAFTPKKVHTATALLALFATQAAQAITLQPVQVLSSPDELLYAEIRFSQADTLDGMKVSVASPDDLASLGIHEKLNTEHLNFYARSNSHGDGVITITSDRPMTAPELNVVIKIEQGNATRLQHVRTPLQSGLTASQIKNQERALMPLVVAEQDISLNLPESNVISMPATEAKLSNANGSKKATGTNHVSDKDGKEDANATAKADNAKGKDSKANDKAKAGTEKGTVTAKTVDAQDKKAETVTAKADEKKAKDSKEKATADKKENTAKAKQDSKTAKQETAKAKTDAKKDANAEYNPEYLTIQRTLRSSEGDTLTTRQDAPPPLDNKAQSTADNKGGNVASAPANAKYVVQPNQTLWKIAHNVAVQTKQPVSDVMKQIHEQNPDAFIQGNIARLRQGATLNLVVAPNFAQPTQTAKKATKAKPSSNRTSQTAKAKRPAQKQQQVQQAKAPQPKRQRLAQAQVSLVAESKQDSAHGTAKSGEGNNATSATLNKKVMQAREKVVSTQKTVSTLETSLKTKDQKVQLLNARLAQLEQQLKNQQVSSVQK